MTQHYAPSSIPDFDVLMAEEREEVERAAVHAQRHGMGVRVKHRGLEIVAYPDPVLPVDTVHEEWDL